MKISTEKQILFIREIAEQAKAVHRVLNNLHVSIDIALSNNQFDKEIRDSLIAFDDNTHHLRSDIIDAIGDSDILTYKTDDEIRDDEIDKIIERQHDDSLRNLSSKL